MCSFLGSARPPTCPGTAPGLSVWPPAPPVHMGREKGGLTDRACRFFKIGRTSPHTRESEAKTRVANEKRRARASYRRNLSRTRGTKLVPAELVSYARNEARTEGSCFVREERSSYRRKLSRTRGTKLVPK